MARISGQDLGSTAPDLAPEQAAPVANSPSRWSRPANEPALILIRHGETEWSRSGQHTGSTDLPLTELGEQQARAAGPLVREVVGPHQPALVLSSPRRRAWHTAELAGYPPDQLTEDAAEWNYGDFEGLTTPQIRQRIPDWTIWAGPVPGGEDAAAVTTRFDRLLGSIASRVQSEQLSGPVLLFCHGHAIRCIAARWLAEPVTAGRHYWLGTGAVSSLGFEHGLPVIQRWNLDSTLHIC